MISNTQSNIDKWQSIVDLWTRVADIAENMRDKPNLYTKSELEKMGYLREPFYQYFFPFSAASTPEEKTSCAEGLMKTAKKKKEEAEKALAEAKAEAKEALALERQFKIALKSVDAGNVESSGVKPSTQDVVQSTNADSKLYGLLKNVLETGFKVVLGNKEYSIETLATCKGKTTLLFKGLKIDPLEYLISDDPILETDSDKEVANIFTRLKDQKEKLFQNDEELKKKFYDKDLYNVANTSGKGNVRSVVQETAPVNIEVTANNKPDAISNLKPMFLEFKNKVSLAELLFQTINRLIAVHENYSGLFHKAVGFAVDGTEDSYMAVYDRTMVDRCPKYSIVVRKVFQRQVPHVWCVLGSQSVDYFASPESGAIVSLLRKCGLEPFGCRICLAAQSSSFVYKITVMTDGFREFMFKLNFDCNRYNKEAAALTAVSGAYHKANVPFYAHGVVSSGFVKDVCWFDNCAVNTVLDTLKKSQAIKYASGEPSFENNWPLVELEDGQFVGGILMEVGDSKPFEVTQQFTDDIAQSLRLIHKAGYIHTDIRANNMMFFAHKVGKSIVYKHSMIDFDLAVAIDTKVIIQEYSGQYEACSRYMKGRVTKSVGNDGVAWGPTDDYHMLLDYVVRKLSSAPKVSNLKVTRVLSHEMDGPDSANEGEDEDEEPQQLRKVRQQQQENKALHVEPDQEAVSCGEASRGSRKCGVKSNKEQQI